MLAKFLSNNSGTTAVTYVDDVFSAYTYTGNGSTQTITNGIDLAGRGGMVWVKERTTAQNHNLWDSERGLGAYLKSNTTDTTSALSGMSFTPTGMSITGAGSVWNASGLSYVSWTFAKAPKFFDVVTWVGSGVDGQTISHSLGGTPGGIIIKRTDTSSGWATDFRHTSGRYHGLLNTTDACNNGSSPAAVTMTNGYTAYVDGTSFALYAGSTGRANVNASGGTYVAYLFAHDTATDGIVQCGSFTTDGSGNASVSLGWEPQFSMWKTSSGAGSWYMSDTSRGSTTDGAFNYLIANTSGAEASGTGYKINATGFTVAGFGASVTYIYLAIRRPNKPPTVGTQVYNAIARTGTGAAATVTGVGFAPDLLISKYREVNSVASLHTRLNGTAKQFTVDASAVLSRPDEVTAFGMGGYSLGTSVVQGLTNFNTKSYVYFSFRRAPLFMDVVYTTGQAFGPSAHNLRAVPELIITKGIGAANVTVLYGPAAAGNTLYMNQTAAVSSIGDISAYTSISNFCTYASGGINEKVHILFATLAGISKVGTYTGNATTNQINCGFTTGARFVLIKRTDSTGDWYIWDTLRGIIAGNDPYVLLNSTAAEVTTTDYIDAYTSGFELSSTAPAAINASGGTYLYLAIT